ncbi:unnamed protein product (macronuclear) [Paramecium tetraurelia]|uniref:Uncharacterized protein n=1 Tax=Paramecium tetraurelia TaxID=5888 RepID=A0DYN9_PARTE|nr:uncharacterized protein GSPATT00003124001 [Paramecium tetraurelia]CAK88156.1 unnamed protein product [Paramecium tetraurelia]|eukprot:XP_001455553.1 hypothetical protein (macronuclear) [Paramecium tetraurelia strain d4-2]
MDNLQNAQNSPIATYQLFIKRSLTRQINNQKVLPVFGCKINLQSPRIQNHHFNLQHTPKMIQTTKSHSINPDLIIAKNLPKKDSSYHYHIDEITKRKSPKKFNFDNSLTNSNLFKTQSKPYKAYQNVVLPQLSNPLKMNKQFTSKINITEPTITEELQPWEQSKTSIPYF